MPENVLRTAQTECCSVLDHLTKEAKVFMLIFFLLKHNFMNASLHIHLYMMQIQTYELGGPIAAITGRKILEKKTIGFCRLKIT